METEKNLKLHMYLLAQTSAKKLPSSITKSNVLITDNFFYLKMK
jgi:hypothetical protein